MVADRYHSFFPQFDFKRKIKIKNIKQNKLKLNVKQIEIKNMVYSKK